MPLRLIDGNEAIAWGAHFAGCRFYAGYPITPATSIFNTMLRILPAHGGTVIQAEDEIAAFGYCIGASMAGLKAMTATSGPGLSLYSEQISFAIGSEIPLVVVDVQRLGPSTGSATKGADGDIQFMRWGSSGGQPVIVLSPVDVADCFRLTMEGFNLAERYRCPVFIASNKEVGQTRESIDLERLAWPEVEDRRRAASGGEYLPFRLERLDGAPAFLPIGGETLVRQTSSTHGEDGYITTDPEEIHRMQEHRRRKIEDHADELSLVEPYGSKEADVVILTYGVTARAAYEAFAQCQAEGKSVSLLVLKTLWPVPERRIKEHIGQKGRILVVEMNQGQYVREVERIAKDRGVRFLGRMDGELISPKEIKEHIDDWIA